MKRWLERLALAVCRRLTVAVFRACGLQPPPIPRATKPSRPPVDPSHP